MYMWRSDVIPQDSYLELTNSVRLAARAHQGSAHLSPSAEIRGMGHRAWPFMWVLGMHSGLCACWTRPLTTVLSLQHG